MRNTSYLKSKSKQHLITRLSPYSYRLTSGSSGRQYIVNLRKDGSCSCSCPWGLSRPANDKRSACSHTLAVMSYIKGMEEERRVNVHSGMDEAHRSHRQIVNQFDGLVITSRKA